MGYNKSNNTLRITMDSIWTRIAEAQAKLNVLEDANIATAAGNAVGLTTTTFYGPKPEVATPTLLQTKQDKLAAIAAEKLQKIRPEAKTELRYQLQNWINPIKNTINYLLPESLELQKYQLDPTTGREYKLDEDTNKRMEGGRFNEQGDWQREYVTPEFAPKYSLMGTHEDPIFVKDANDQFTALENKVFVQDANAQTYADMIAAMDAENTVTLDPLSGTLKDKAGRVVKEQPGRVYNFAAADGQRKAGRSIGYVRHAKTGKWVEIPEEARYTPGLAYKLSGGAISEEYGWAPGTKGVDLENINHYSKAFKMEDAVLREGLENALRYTEGSNTNKMQPWYTQFTNQQEKDYGSGKSEYYDAAKAGKIVGDATRGKALLDKYKQSDDYVKALHNFETKNLGEAPNEIAQAIRNIPGALGKGILDTADTLQELATYIPQEVYNQMHGTNIDIDLFKDKDKAELKNKINKFTGYLAEFDEADQKKAMRQLAQTGIDMGDPSTWSKVFELDAATKIGKAAATMLTNPSMTVENVVPIIGAGLGLKVAGKVTGAVGSKVTPNLTNALQKATTTKYDEVMGAYNKAVKAVKNNPQSVIAADALAKSKAAVDALTVVDKAKKLAIGSYMSNADFMNRMNEDITQFKANNNEIGMDTEKLLTATLLNKLGAEWSAYNIRTLLKPDGTLKDGAKKQLNNKLNAFLDSTVKSAKIVGGLTRDGLKETIQEVSDSVMQVINQNYGSVAYKDKTMQDVISLASDDILFGAIAGFAGGAHMSAVGSTGKVINAAKDIKAEMDAKTLEEQKATAAANRTEWMIDKGEDYTTYTEEQRVDEPDVEVTKVKTAEGDKEVTIFREPANLKVESTNADEYAKKLEEQKNQVVQSVYEVDNTGRVIGLSRDAKAMINKDPEALEAKVNKVNAWLDKYANEYAIGEDAMVPKAIQNQVDYYKDSTAVKAQLEDMYKAKQATPEDKALRSVKQEIANLEEKMATANATDRAAMEVKLNELKVKKNEALNQSIGTNIALRMTDDVSLDKASQEEIAAAMELKIRSRMTEELKKEWPEQRIKEVANIAAEKTYKMRGKYRMDVVVDMEEEIQRINAKSQRKQAEKTKVIDGTKINGNTLIQGLQDGDISTVAKEADAQMQSSNLNHRVLGKIDDVDGALIAKDIADKIDKTVKENTDKLSTVFTEAGIADGDGAVLLINVLGAINAATDTDTKSRLNVTADEATEANLAKDDYWASENNVLMQIGKDFLTSRGLKLAKSTPEKQAEQYIKIGRVGLELAIASGLVERSASPVWSVVSDKLKLSDNKTAAVSKNKAQDMISGNDVRLLETDYGVRIVGKGNQNQTKEFGQLKAYDNEVGSIAARINKLLVSNNYEVPGRKPGKKEDIPVTGGVNLYDDGAIEVLDTIQKFQETEYKVKEQWVEFFKKTKLMMNGQSFEKYTNTNEGRWLADMLGLNQYKTQIPILADTDKGVTGGLKDVFNGIMDNIESLEVSEADGGFHLSYGVGTNRRVVVLDTAINPQNDKVIARQIMTSAKAENGLYEIGDETAKFDTYVEMLNELGFKATGNKNVEEQYKEAYKIIMAGKEYREVGKGSLLGNKELTKGQKLAYYIVELTNKAKNGKLDIIETSKAINENGKVTAMFSKLGGKSTIKTISILQGFKDMQDSKGEKTSYIPGSDAKASGVMITLLNILGYDTELEDGQKTKAILESLGIRFSDTGKIANPKDAYNLLQDKVLSLLEGLNEGTVEYEKYDTQRTLIGYLEVLGIDTRELAKPPVMTWFYTAGEETIMRDLAESVLEQVLRAAYNGDAKAQEHIAKITGKECTPTGLRKFTKNGPEHKALMEAYKSIGKLYSEQLDKAFPGVAKYKKQMKDIFETVQKEGQEFATGELRAASSAVYGENGNDTFNVFKRITHELDVADEKLKDKPELQKEMGERRLVTEVKKVANWTSVLPLLAQNSDFTQLEYTMRGLYAKYGKKDDFAPMTRHDDIVAPMKYMNEIGKDRYNKAMVDIAKNYDFTNVLIEYAENTLAKMESVKDKDKLLEQRIKRLSESLEKWKATNKPRAEYKRDELNGVKVELIGLTELKSDKGTTEQVKAEPKEPKKTSEDMLRETVQKAKEGVVFDTEFTFNHGDNGVVYELAYGDMEKSVILDVTIDASNYYPERWKDMSEEEMAAKFVKEYPEYRTLKEVQDIIANAKKAGVAVKPEEAIRVMLDSLKDKELVGYNQKGKNSDAHMLINTIKDLDLKKELETKLSTSIDMYEVVQDYRTNSGVAKKEGTQSDVAAILGIFGKAHTAAEDVGMLNKIIDGLSKAADTTLELMVSIKQTAKQIKKRQAIEEFGVDSKKDLGEAINTLVNRLAFDQGTKEILAKQGNKVVWEFGEESTVETRDGKTVITLKKGVSKKNAESIIDLIGHELEHANTAGLIEAIANGKRPDLKSAYDTILKVLDKVDGKQQAGGRLARILEEKDDVTRVVEAVAVIRGEKQGGEGVVQEISDLGIVDVVIEGFKKAAKTIIATVRNKMAKGDTTDAVLDVEQLVQAVETLHKAGLMVSEGYAMSKRVNYKADVKIKGADKLTKQQLDTISDMIRDCK